MTLVTFEGAGPFALPAAQYTEATAQAENIEMTLFVLVKGEPTPVQVMMTEPVACELGRQLLQAGIEARANTRRSGNS